MYAAVLGLHSLLRWVVLLLAAWALFRGYSGWMRGRPWSGLDRQAGLIFSIVLDIQVLLGLILAFVSPLVQNVLVGVGAAMQAPHLRFFLIEHIPLMLLALILVHFGSNRARNARDDQTKHRRAAVMYTLGKMATVVAIPWWRALLPGLG